VHFGVVPARLGMMVFSMAGVSVSGVGMMRRLLVIAGLVVLGRFTMMLGGVLVVLGGFSDGAQRRCACSYVLPGQTAISWSSLRRLPDSTLTVSRQVCCGAPPAARSETAAHVTKVLLTIFRPQRPLAENLPGINRRLP
jgi:hypothetical protein